MTEKKAKRVSRNDASNAAAVQGTRVSVEKHGSKAAKAASVGVGEQVRAAAKVLEAKAAQAKAKKK